MDIASIALSGLNQAQASLESAAKRLSAEPASTSSLPTDIVDLLQAKNNFAANIIVLKNADDFTKHTIDLLA